MENANVTLENTPALAISELTKAYGKQVVIRDLNLTVERGEVFGFIGRNGTGKSTTIGCMVGLKPFKKGRILIGGHDIQQDTIEAKKLLGYVPSEPSCYEMMTGREFLSFIASAFGLTAEAFDTRIQELVARFDFNPVDLDRRIGHYSLGMKQKISLMSALVHDPLLWVLDEPTIGLDAPATAELAHTLRQQAKEGRSVFITSHSIEFVARCCDRVAILAQENVARIVDLRGGETFADLKLAYDTICLNRSEAQA